MMTGIKKLFFPVAALLILGAGCSASAPDNGLVGKKFDKELAEKCFPLQRSSGEYIFTVVDAKNIRGGNWETSQELKIDPWAKYLSCFYYLDGDDNNQIILHTYPIEIFQNRKNDPDFRSIDGFGEWAAFETVASEQKELMLNIQKGATIVNINCIGTNDHCAEEYYLKIGRLIDSRWP